MKQFMITFCAYRTEDTGIMLRTASKIVEDLQASNMTGELVPPPAPWQIAIVGTGHIEYIRRQILDICQRGEVAAVIKELPSL